MGNNESKPHVGDDFENYEVEFERFLIEKERHKTSLIRAGFLSSIIAEMIVGIVFWYVEKTRSDFTSEGVSQRVVNADLECRLVAVENIVEALKEQKSPNQTGNLPEQNNRIETRIKAIEDAIGLKSPLEIINQTRLNIEFERSGKELRERIDSLSKTSEIQAARISSVESLFYGLIISLFVTVFGGVVTLVVVHIVSKLRSKRLGSGQADA